MGVIPYNYITFDGKNLGDFGVWVSGSGTFNAPARDISTVSVPGRNGDLTFDNGRYNNITVSYPAFISRRFQPRLDDLRAWICSKHEYCRLEDTYHPEEFRMGIFKGGLSVSPTARNIAGSFTLSFDCKPQRYLKSGEQVITYDGNGLIYNPTQYPAKPLIKLYGTAGQNSVVNIQVHGTSVTHEVIIKMPDEGYVMIDCETEEVYCGQTNLNASVSFPERNPDHSFPVIAPDAESGVLVWNSPGLELTPRWWTL